MARQPGTTSKAKSELDTGQFAELASSVLRHLPRDFDSKVAQHLITSPGLLRVMLEELRDDARVLRIDQTWFGPVTFGEALFIPEAVFADAAVRSYMGMGPEEMSVALRRKAHWPRPVRKQPYILWSEGGSLRSIDALRAIKVRGLQAATPIELVACFKRLSLPEHVRGLLGLQPADLGSGVQQIGQYDRLTDQPFWKFDLPRREQEWHPRYGFLAFSTEDAS